MCLQMWKQKSQNGIESLHLAMVTKLKRLQFRSKTVSTQKEKHPLVHDLYLRSSPEHHH